MTSAWHVAYAWLSDGLHRDVLIEVDEGRIATVTPERTTGSGQSLAGVALPGLVNAHSHAFHRAIRGRTHAAGGDFWEWRRHMYQVAARLDPESYHRLARAVFGEMALAGITCVGEFHYLHHGPEGQPYPEPNEMGLALIEAAGEAGIRITLLDACYLRSGFDEAPLDATQLRFSDGHVGTWSARVDALVDATADMEHVRVGVAAHSVRALDIGDIAGVGGLALRRDLPMHFHLSEQPAENEAAYAATGLTPAQLFDHAGILDLPLVTAVHATHISEQDITMLAGCGVGICLCPTTERDLGDGIGPAAEMVAGGISLSLGSDSHAVVDLFEEARAVEMNDRLRTGRRGLHATRALFHAATSNGAAALGWSDHGIVPGALADFVVVDVDNVRTAGWGGSLGGLISSVTAADVTDVVVGGRHIVRNGTHATLGHVAGALGEAIDAV